MSEIGFLSLETVFELHRRSLIEHGGSAGLRDRGAIESATGQAMNAFYYGGADIFGIAEAQAFLDGNKRTAIAAALAFLAANRQKQIPTQADRDALYDAMIGIAKHELDKTGLAALFRRLVA